MCNMNFKIRQMQLLYTQNQQIQCDTFCEFCQEIAQNVVSDFKDFALISESNALK